MTMTSTAIQPPAAMAAISALVAAIMAFTAAMVALAATFAATTAALAAARAAWAAALAALAVACAVRWAALAACCVVLILAFAVFSAVLMDLLAVFTVPLAVESACLMVLRPLSTVLMLFFPLSRVLTAPRSCRSVFTGSEILSAACRVFLAACFSACFFGCSAAALRFWIFSLTLEMFSFVVFIPLRPCLSNWWIASWVTLSTPEERRSDAYSPGELSAAYRLWSALSLVRIYASFIRSEATAALSIALMPFFSETLVLLPLPMGFTSFPGRGRPYSSSSLATTTIRPLVREYSQVERVMSWSPYSALTLVS